MLCEGDAEQRLKDYETLSEAEDQDAPVDSLDIVVLYTHENATIGEVVDNIENTRDYFMDFYHRVKEAEKE